MTLPFTTAEFFEVMQRYNEAVWPAQVGLTTGAVLIVALLWTRARYRSVLISARLALLWAWSGLVYHLAFFYVVNAAALLFGALFIAAAALFAWHGVVKRRLQFELVHGTHAGVGLALIAYALVVYPELGSALGHTYPRMPTFGLPCPLTIFTIGMLAFAAAPCARVLLIVPLAWSVVALQAAFRFGMYEDFGLLAATLAGAWLVLHPAHRTTTA